ncbi:MAG: metalloregulator ArsR/SmtB family transcription factor [Thermoguttaceae bacterium]|jgi:DNA-binding transcriptional ArsR family regulator
MKATRTPKLIAMKNLEEAADCLKTLAHPVRLRMLQLMLQGAFTVGELAAACEIPSHMASEHLRMMQHCGFLNRRQDGRRIYYQVAEPSLQRIMKCIETRFGDGCSHE